MVVGCKAPSAVESAAKTVVPEAFSTNTTTTMQWRNFFTNKNLQNLIDTALQNNQELQITLQEIEIAKMKLELDKDFITNGRS
jgi:outer membrane protein TolC